MSGEKSGPEGTPSSSEEIRDVTAKADIKAAPVSIDVSADAAKPVQGPKDKASKKDEGAAAISPTDKPETAAESVTAKPWTTAPEAKPAPAKDAEPPKPAQATAPKPAAVEMPPAPLANPPARKGGFFAPLLGGVLAAGCGFALAHYVPQGWPLAMPAAQPNEQVLALESRQAEQQREIETLKAAASPSDPSLGGRVEALETRLGALDPTASDTALQALRDEVAALKQSLAALPEGTQGALADDAGLRAELEALRGEVSRLSLQSAGDLEALRAATKAERDAAEARAEAIRSEAEATARAALVRGAVLRVQAALETGTAFEDALADLQSAGVTVPATLAGQSAGLSTLAALQADFPDVAREALAASNAPAPDAGIGERFTAFLSAQTNLRSLTPQEGSSPDAVLSRAEAKVLAGDLAAALAELDQLAPEAAAPTQAWRARAEARLAANAAAQQIISDITTP